MNERRWLMVSVGALLLVLTSLALGILWLVGASTDTWCAFLICSHIFWMLYGVWVGIDIGWDDCVEDMIARRDREPVLRRQCAWCAPGADLQELPHSPFDPRMVSHGICDKCACEHFGEFIDKEGRQWQP